MIRIPADFKEFLRLLNERKVEYLVIGGYAVAFHGFPRPTGDLDIWISIEPGNVDRVIAALQEFGFGGSEIFPEIFARPRAIIRFGVPPVRIEIQTAVSGVTFSECFSHRIVSDLDGVTINVIDLRHLKLNKRAAGRHKDLSDLENLP